MAKKRFTQEVVDKQQALSQDKQIINIWGFKEIFVPILMQPDNQVLALKRLMARVDLPYRTNVSGEKLEAFYIQEYPIKLVLSLDLINLNLNIAAEYTYLERGCCEFGSVSIGTFFVEHFNYRVAQMIDTILRQVKKC